MITNRSRAWRCGRARGSAARTELVRNEVLGAQLSNQRVYARRRAAHMRLRRRRHDAGSTVNALLQAARCAAAVGKGRVNRAGRLSSSKLAALGCMVHARAPCPICRRCSWMSRTLGKFHAMNRIVFQNSKIVINTMPTMPRDTKRTVTVTPVGKAGTAVTAQEVRTLQARCLRPMFFKNRTKDDG